MIGWLKQRRAQRDRHDELRVLHAIRVLRPSQATEPPIARLAGISLVRVYNALARLEQAGEVTSEWQKQCPYGLDPGQRVYRSAGSRLVEAGR